MSRVFTIFLLGVLPVLAGDGGWAGKQYIIGQGDTLRVTVSGHDGLNGTYSLNSTGAITLPGVGTFKAAGDHPPHLSRQIFAAIGAEARVSIVSDGRAYLWGEVRQPGSCALKPSMTLTEAIRFRGGLTEFARKKSVDLVRHGQRIVVDVNAVAKGLSADPILQSGDIVFAP